MAEWRARLEIYDLARARSRVILQTDLRIEAPNFYPDGQSLLVNGAGRLMRVPLGAPELLLVETGFANRCNNDHGFSPDGRQIYFGHHRENRAEIFTVPLVGGVPQLVSPQAPSWFHGCAPDGAALVYPAARGGTRVVDIYTLSQGIETRLTQGEGHSDGPDFSADGAWIYYNSDRTGHAQIWRMRPDGTEQHQLFADNYVNWFPHPSPNGQDVLYLAYPAGTLGHPRDLPVALCLMDVDGQSRRRVIEMTGGQGSINVPCWSPDGGAFAYMRYA